MARTTLSESVKRDLLDQYIAVRDRAGWLIDFWEGGTSLEEIAYLEELDDDLRGYRPEFVAQDWADKILRDGGIEIYEAETDEQKLSIINRQILNQWNLVGLAMELDEPFYRVEILMDVAKKKEKLRWKFRGRQIHLEQPFRGVTEYEINRAREYPLENLTGAKRIPCPFHNGDGKNFSVKDSFGLCFVCNEWCDGIKWLMTQENYSFVEAVKKLQGGL